MRTIFSLLIANLNCVSHGTMKTWQEIKDLYPKEHVVIANPKFPQNDLSQLEGGEVIDHDPELDDLLNRCDLSKYDSCAVTYTGDLGEVIGERGMIRVIEDD